MGQVKVFRITKVLVIWIFPIMPWHAGLSEDIVLSAALRILSSIIALAVLPAVMSTPRWRTGLPVVGTSHGVRMEGSLMRMI